MHSEGVTVIARLPHTRGGEPDVLILDNAGQDVFPTRVGVNHQRRFACIDHHQSSPHAWG